MRRDALGILRAALRAADPVDAVRRHLRIEGSVLIAGRQRYRLETFERIFVIGAGKASASMAQAVERLLGKRLTGGLINVKYGHTASLKRVELNESAHPVPDENGLRGAARIGAIARDAGERDLILCLISGGGSALLPLPVPPVTLQDKQKLTQLLLDCGANIHEINCLRKHLSLLKGGQLARIAAPARILTLVLSDVIGDDLDTIGSGPTVPDRSTFADAAELLTRFGLWEKAPRSIVHHIRAAEHETPKPGDPLFRRVQNLIVGSNRLAVDAAQLEARKLGYRTLVLSTLIQGETKDVARMHAAIAMEALATGRPIKPPACIISGGETTVTIRGQGLGGRNQEFALAAAIDIAGLPNITVLSAGTDGTDGPTDAAGAIADGTTLQRAQQQGLDARAFLDRNDSYHFFDALHDLIKTGPTKTNVMDVRIMLIS